MKTFMFLILLMLISIPAYAKDKTITICSYEWPPHHGKTLKDGGYTADIIKEIFEPQGYKINKMFLSWKRAQQFAKEGTKCDAITEIYFNEERLNHYWFGAPYSVHEVYLIGLKSHHIKEYNSLDELKEYIIGYNSGGSLSKEFDTADYLTKRALRGYEVGIKLVLNKRIDFFVAAKSVAMYEASKLGAFNKIHTIGKVMQRQYVHMAFSKKNKENLIRMQDYNQGLFSLLKSGKYAEIMKKHAIN